jgi:hypothetical protein
VVDEPEVREVDRRNGNAARARRQAQEAPRVTEDEHGNVIRSTATALVIPEEKRCTALTIRGERCKAGRMRGLSYCTFHAHKALDDEALIAQAGNGKPRLTPRKALQHVVQQQADQLADAAVRGALSTEGPRATSAVLALVDAVDPLVQTEERLDLTSEGMTNASYKQLRAVFGSNKPF